jgi:AraC-like DNA-binding protein
MDCLMNWRRENAMPRPDKLKEEIYRAAPGLAVAEALFESVDDAIYCVKNRRRQYIAVNRAFVARLRLPNKAALLGRTAQEIFPMPLAIGYEQQDDAVFLTGREIRDRLERVTNLDGEFGWFLAHKVPIRDARGGVIALAGISRDLRAPAAKNPQYAAVADVIETIQRDYAQPLRVDELARRAGMPLAQFERGMRAAVHISPRQFLTKTRIDAAALALRESSESLREIALQCGFYDQATFCRQFRQATGLTPRQYREMPV